MTMNTSRLPLTLSAECNLFVASMPKSGTHLLCSIVEQVWGKYPLSIKKSQLSEFQALDHVIRGIGLRGLACARHFRYLELKLPQKFWRTLVLI